MLDVVGFSGESDEHLSIGFDRAQFGEYVDGGLEFDAERALVLF